MHARKLLIAMVAAVLAGACAQTAKEADEPEADTVSRQEISGAAATPAAHEQREAVRAAFKHRDAAHPAGPASAADVLGSGRYAPFITDRENYQHFADGRVLRADEHPVSTFSVDVDTGAYANVRRLLREGRLPPRDAVRVEELINYFEYSYAPPKSRDAPFSVHTELAPAPWNPKTQLLRIGLQGWQPAGALPPANLVFLVDVSGSMHSPDKLPLVKSSLRLLVNELDARDRVSLVVYAGNTGVVLEPTPADQKAKILSAVDRLEAGGSTNGGAGIQLAYAMAQQGFIENGINRVLVATDGDFNVGTVNFEQLKNLVEERRASGIALSTLGFGTGNYNDHLMEQLADAGNGNYTYVDGLQEARRALVKSRAATLLTIAKDVKIQVEFNPDTVAEYRLIGYENRALNREDFNNDRVDAGDIGAGHSVTALYELSLAGGGGARTDALRYGSRAQAPGKGGELAFLRIRYKPGADGEASRLIERAITRAEMKPSLEAASESLRFAAAVAAFGQLLRGGRYTESYSLGDVLALARTSRGTDADGWRGEFLQLVDLAGSLSMRAAQSGSVGRENCDSERGCG